MSETINVIKVESDHPPSYWEIFEPQSLDQKYPFLIEPPTYEAVFGPTETPNDNLGKWLVAILLFANLIMFYIVYVYVIFF